MKNTVKRSFVLLLCLAMLTLCSCSLFQGKSGTAIKAFELSESQIQLSANESRDLEINIEPADIDPANVQWTSSDTNVATVDINGNVVAVGTGACSVTAQLGNAKAVCVVVVAQSVPEKLTLSETDIELTAGEGISLSCTVSPDDAFSKAVFWSSSDITVASVDQNGNITAVGEGNCVITATAVNGITASCDISVTSILPETVSLSSYVLDLSIGDVYGLSVSIDPYDVTDSTLVWSSSDESIAAVDSEGNITAKAEGVCTVTATAVNGITASCSVTVSRPIPDLEAIYATYGDPDEIWGYGDYDEYGSYMFAIAPAYDYYGNDAIAAIIDINEYLGVPSDITANILWNADYGVHYTDNGIQLTWGYVDGEFYVFWTHGQ